MRTRIFLFALVWATIVWCAHPGGFHPAILPLTIVEDQRFEIDRYANIFADQAYINGHYYFGRHPGYGMLCVPSVAVMHLTYENLVPKTVQTKLDDYLAKHYNKAEMPEIREASKSISLLKLLVTSLWMIITVSAVFAGLLAVVFYEFLGRFQLKECDKLLMSLTLVFGTLICVNVAVNNHAPYVFFALTSFAMIYRMKSAVPSNFDAFLGGCALATPLMFEYHALPAAVLVGVYAMSLMKPRQYPFLILGGMFALAPLLLYHTINYGSPFKIHLNFPEGPNNYWGNRVMHHTGFLGMSFPHPEWMMTFLFSAKYGFFLLMPVALIGMAYAVRTAIKEPALRREAILVIGIFLAYWLPASSANPHVGGIGMGPRFMIGAVPFVMLFAALALREKGFWRSAVLITASISLIIWFTVVQYPMPYETFVNSANPLVDYHWPMVKSHLVYSVLVNHAASLLHFGKAASIALNVIFILPLLAATYALFRYTARNA